MRFVTILCPACRQSVTAEAAMFDHYVIDPHQLDRKAYLTAHPRTRRENIPEIPALCPSSDQVLHNTDPRFKPTDEPPGTDRQFPPPNETPMTADPPY